MYREQAFLYPVMHAHLRIRISRVRESLIITNKQFKVHTEDKARGTHLHEVTTAIVGQC